MPVFIASNFLLLLCLIKKISHREKTAMSFAIYASSEALQFTHIQFVGWGEGEEDGAGVDK